MTDERRRSDVTIDGGEVLIHGVDEAARSAVFRAIADEVWAEALARPSFRAALDEGLADLAAGRTYRLDTKTGETTPNPDWPKDGPQPRERHMTDEPQPTPDEAIQAEAKVLAQKPPEPVAGAEGLPDDVRDGDVEAEETP